MRRNPFVNMTHSHLSNRAKPDTRVHSLPSLRETWLFLRSWALGLRRSTHPSCHYLDGNGMFCLHIAVHNEATLSVRRTFPLWPVSIRRCLYFTLITLPSLSNNIPCWPIFSQSVHFSPVKWCGRKRLCSDEPCLAMLRTKWETDLPFTIHSEQDDDLNPAAMQ